MRPIGVARDQSAHFVQLIKKEVTERSSLNVHQWGYGNRTNVMMTLRKTTLELVMSGVVLARDQ